MSECVGAFFANDDGHGEHWEGPFETAAAAIDEVRALSGEGAVVFVGVGEEIDLDGVCSGLGDAVIDRIAERMSETAGESSDLWPDLSDEDGAALDELLKTTVASFLRDRGYSPSFVTIGKVTRHGPEAKDHDGDDPLYDLPRLTLIARVKELESALRAIIDAADECDAPHWSVRASINEGREVLEKL